MTGLKKKLTQLFNKHRSELISLIGVFFLAFILRILFLGQNALSFAFDQARDAFIVKEILSGDFKIQGPSVSGIPGFYHGVFYYYFILIPYWIGGGSPVAVAYWMSFFNSLTVFIVYFFAKEITQNKYVAFAASLLFAFSFEASQYAVWISNPAMAIWFVPGIYFGLYFWVKNKKSILWPLVCGMALGLSMQSNISLMYHLVPVLLYLIANRANINKKGIIFWISALILASSTIVFSQIKFGFPAIAGIKHILNSIFVDGNQNGAFGFLSKYFNEMNILLSNNLFSQNVVLGSILGWLIIAFGIIKLFVAKKDGPYLLLSLWILSYMFSSLLGGYGKPHIGVGIGVGVLILASDLIYTVSKKSKLIASALFFLLILANLSKILSENNKGQTIFAVQPDMILRNELKAVDYTYSKSQGSSFSINTLTSPLFINTTWSYLYAWYGKEKYGYLPQWSGHNQVGSLGNQVMEFSKPLNKHYLIFEDMSGIPDIYKVYAVGDEDARTNLNEAVNFGKIEVQERITKK